MQITREFYIPRGATKFEDRNSSAVVYASECDRWFRLIGFHGRAQKPDFNYRYAKTEQGRADREKRARQFFAGWQRHEESKRKARAEVIAWQHDYKPGDIFSTCWGYEQTNREYWQCVEVRGKMLVVREIAREYEATGWDRGESVPQPGNFISEPYRVKASRYGFKDPRYKHIASRMEPVAMIGAKPVFGAQYESSYA